ncbi:MAG: hypothetical protein GXX96_15340 [Planctomycetaceae bacterium]|nr:hypothetical protein [Planctomycetaceae bacterium]
MWRCSQCGEAIPDNFDACWRCGTNRDGTASEDFRPKPDDASEPDPKSELTECGRSVGGEVKFGGCSERALTRENLAELLLRFLGVCFTALGIIGGVEQVSYLLSLSREFGLNDALGHYQWWYLTRSAAELIVGVYFLVGGQWVFDKILTPISSVSPEETDPVTEEGGSDDPQVSDRDGTAGNEQPQRPPLPDQPGG